MNDKANLFDEIQSLCREFRHQLKKAKSPSIEDYLSRVDTSSREMLFQNLLLLELEFRRKQRDDPSPDEYIERFPELGRVVRQAFFESTIMSQVDDETPSDQWTYLYEAPAARKLGEYELLRQMGRGNFGAVYKARHLKRGDIVAIKLLPIVDGKVLPSSDAERIHKFRREFKSLAEINHPNLVGMQAIEFDGNQWFFTMDLVDGDDFIDYVRPEGELDESRLRDAIRQLVDGVITLHHNRIIHRDLKPSNVMVDRGGRVVVLDFGLIVEQQHQADLTVSMTAASFAGTPRYAAPEQMMGESSPASDWYSVGTMIFEALTGAPPFPGSNPMSQKREVDAPRLSGEQGIPGDLAGLVDELLSRSPSRRPDEAALAKALGIELLAMSTDSDNEAGASPDRADPTLIGRETQLTELETALQSVHESREPVVVFVSGKSGEGKTSLVNRFLNPLRLDRNVLVLSGRCYDRESVPFKAVDTIIDALVRFLRRLAYDDVVQWLHDDTFMLAHLFPILRRVEAIADRSTGGIPKIDERQIRYRAFYALRKLLVRVCHAMPVTVFIDDLQWGDADSAEVLFDLLSPPEAPNVLLIGSHRSDDADESQFLAGWRSLIESRSKTLETRYVRVAPLTEAQCLTMLATRTSVEIDEIREQATELFHDTRGNPYFLEQLIEGFDTKTGRFIPVPLYEIIDRKMMRLPNDAADFLSAIAIAGQAVELHEACSVVGHETPLFDTITRMRSERLVRLIGSGERQLVDTYHDKIRETVLYRMKASKRREMNGRLAALIEDRDGGLTDAEIDTLVTRGELTANPLPTRVYDLAYHWDAAADTRRALAYGLAAAIQARGQFALEIAARLYALADRNAVDAPSPARFQIARGLGETLLLRGDYEQARVTLDRALTLAESQYDTADVIGLKGVSAHRMGMIEDSIGHFEDAIGRLGVSVPRTGAGLWLRLAKEVLTQTVHSLVPSRLHRRRSDRGNELCNWLLGQIEWPYYQSHVPSLLWASFVGLNRAERVPPSPSLLVQYVVHANDMCVLGWRSRAEKYYEAARDLSGQLNDDWGAALAMSHSAMGSIVAPSYEKGVEKARAGIEMFSKIGDVGERHIAHFFLTTNLFGLGNLIETAKEAQELLHSCISHDDNFVASLALSMLTKGCLGHLPFDELVDSVRLLPGNRLGQTSLLIAKGTWHSHHGRTGEAVSTLEQAWHICRNNQYLTPFNFSVVSELATSLRRHAEVMEAQSLDSAEVRQRWQRTARLANRLTWFFSPGRPHSLRELSLAYAHQGRIKKAWKLINKSCRIAEHQTAHYEHAQSLLVKGKFAEELGDQTSVEQIRIAQLRIDEIEGALHEARQNGELGSFRPSPPDRQRT